MGFKGKKIAVMSVFKQIFFWLPFTPHASRLTPHPLTCFCCENSRLTLHFSVDSNLAIIIPVRLFPDKLPSVLDQVMQYIPPDRVLVVNDGYSGLSVMIGQEMGVHLILHRKKLGKGISLREGFKFWRERGMEWAITLDGDGQHDPSDLPKFIDAAQRNRADLVIGSRMLSSNGMPWDRRFSNRTSSFIISHIIGKKIPDSQCGFRLVRLEALEGIIWREDGFAFESEMILRFSQKNLVIDYIPIRTVYEPNQESSIRRLPDTFRFLRMIARSRQPI